MKHAPLSIVRRMIVTHYSQLGRHCFSQAA